MGTFTARVGSVFSRSTVGNTLWYSGLSYPANPTIQATNQQLVDAILVNDWTDYVYGYSNPDGEYSGRMELVFNIDNDAIELDTGTVSYTGLPAGFILVSVTLHINLLAADPAAAPGSFNWITGFGSLTELSDSPSGNQVESTTTLGVTPSPFDLFFGQYGWNLTLADPINKSSAVGQFYITGVYSLASRWWRRRTAVAEIPGVPPLTTEEFVQQAGEPDGYDLYLDGETAPEFHWWVWIDSDGFSRYWLYQVNSPGTGWTSSVTPPDPNGWWLSSLQFGGSTLIVAGARPKDPRDFLKISTWATGSAGALGGSPSCMFRNRMIYAANNYTSGTDYPPIRIFDGNFDRELCRLPPTGAGVVPKGILSFLVANGTIYLSTFDSGTSSADWAGRVFELDVDSGTLTPIGAAFTSGQMPYALAWHNGRLWVGTNRQVASAAGKIYWFRPDIDSSWTEDRDLSTDSLGGVTSMVSFHGTLYVGTSAPAGTFAKILQRASDGTYSTALTATGGTATANNAFLSMRGWDDLLLYAGYWNNDTPAVAKLYRLDGTGTWSAVFTGASAANRRPIVALFTDATFLYVIGGGMGLTALLLSTDDGITFTDLTSRLPEADKTALPAYGVLVL